MIYLATCLFSLGVVGLRVMLSNVQIETLAHQTQLLNGKTERLSPQFQRAVTLYEQRTSLRNKLKKIKATTIDAHFIGESLKVVAKMLPKDFWLEKIHISSLAGSKATAGQAKPSQVQAMTIQGRSFIDLESEKPEQVRKFHDVLAGLTPYSLGSGRLDLSDMEVNKTNGRYYHNFTIEFAWLNSLL